MKSSIFEILVKLGLTSKKTSNLFSQNTRDVKGLKVWKDTKSQIIYINNFYTGDQTYIYGNYRTENENESQVNFFDNLRRVNSNYNLYLNKKVLDFGCGSGDFLKSIKPFCKEVLGVELQQNYLDELNYSGISCKNNLQSIKDNSIDMIFSFHVIEHLQDPIDTLSILKNKIISGGKILIGVPHAKDFLL